MSSQYRWAITSLENAQKSNNPVIKYMILKNQPLNFQCWASTSDLQVWGGRWGRIANIVAIVTKTPIKSNCFAGLSRGAALFLSKNALLWYTLRLFQSWHHKLTFTSLCVATIFNTYRPLITLWKPFLSASLNNRKQPMEQAKGLVGQKWSLPKSYLNNGLWPPGYIYIYIYIIYIIYYPPIGFPWVSMF